MRKNILIALLTVGVVGGFGSGFYKMAHGSCRGEHGKSCARWHQQKDDGDDDKKPDEGKKQADDTKQ